MIEKDITIVFRSVGERTEKLCLHHLMQEVPETNIEIIRNQPLKLSTALVCHAAVEADRKYTIMIGADYIPRIGFIQDLYEMAESMTGRWLFVKGTIIDKFLLEFRGDQGGPMLYPTSILKEWLKILPGIPNETTTEASCQRYFKNKGYATRRGKIWLALHDFEQHYRDIYRSMFVAGQKHNRLRKRLFPKWQQLAKEDLDYHVALYAFEKGYNSAEKAKADFREDYGWSDAYFSNWEKEPLDANQIYDVERFEHRQFLKQKNRRVR